MPPSFGMRFGRYELVARLGAGGMGEVWRARDHDLHRDVAVKFLPERFAADSCGSAASAQEARAASSLNHPNIVTIHEIGDTAGLQYIVMELVQGHTLRELLPTGSARSPRGGSSRSARRSRTGSPRRTPRDRPPRPEARERDGDGRRLREDPRLRPREAARRRLRSARQQWFDSAAPTWPESPSPQTAAGRRARDGGLHVARSRRAADPSTTARDQFTLGAILYELATGRRPFRRETRAQTLAAIIERHSRADRQLNPAVPAPVRWLIERLPRQGTRPSATPRRSTSPATCASSASTSREVAARCRRAPTR